MIVTVSEHAKSASVDAYYYYVMESFNLVLPEPCR